MQKATLENWSVVSFCDEYTAPECKKYNLFGNVYNHPRFENGDFIYTSYIKEVNGKIVQTYNTEYTLGKPDKKYVEKCKQYGWHVPTEDCPIKA